MIRFILKVSRSINLQIFFFIIVLSSFLLLFRGERGIVGIKQFIIYSIDSDNIFRNPNFTYLNKDIHVTHLESNFTCARKHLKLLILVTSHPGSFKRRQLIRDTWGKHLHQHPNYDFRTYFVTGKTKDSEEMNSLKNESNIYKDLVIGDFYEHFFNLSLKVQAGFEWSYKHCSSDFILKTDDDLFINMNSLFQKLNKTGVKKKKLFIGQAWAQAWVARRGKYKVMIEEYKDPFYPEYCGGGAFIFSADVVKEIIPYMLQNPFKIDDVYIGMLALNAGVKVTYDPHFRLLAENCTFDNDMIAHHPVENRNCMTYLFSSMIFTNSHSEFLKLHYLGKSKQYSKHQVRAGLQ